jgi:hypothetical protein
VNNTSLSLSGLSISTNKAHGGNGGNGGDVLVASNDTEPAGGAGGEGEGGGLFAMFGSKVTITLTSSQLTGNSALGGFGGNGGSLLDGEEGGAGGRGGQGGSAVGGGLLAGGGTVTLSSGTVDHNLALGGSGGAGGMCNPVDSLGGAGGPGGDAGAGQGGGIAFTGTTLVLKNGVILSANTADGGTGGAAGNGGAGSTGGPGALGGRGGVAQGGGLFAVGGSVSLTQTQVTGSHATAGMGGSGGAGGEATEETGGAGGSGGAGGLAQGAGLYVSQSQLTLDRSTVDDNLASGGAGGLGGNGGTADEDTGGTGGSGGAGGLAQGGGLFVYSCKTRFVNSTVSDNTVTAGPGGDAGAGGPGSDGGGPGGSAGSAGTAQGGGLYLEYGSHSLSSDTIAFNTASGGLGGGVFEQATTIDVVNTIVAQDKGDATAPDFAGVFHLAVADFIGNGAGSNLAQANPDAHGNRVGGPGAVLDPKLGPLLFNGGPTPTHRPNAGSPVIDAGSDSFAQAIATDQRGFARLVGSHTDIGAVEFQWKNEPSNGTQPPHGS